MSTNSLSAKDIKRSWHLVDAKNKILGRLAGEVALLLMGKNKPSFVPYLDNGDYVVIVNADKIKVSGQKETQKKYVRVSGYPGGYREETLNQVRQTKPEKIITHAVKGMIPRNKLGAVMLKKLHVYVGTDHPYKNQFKKAQTESETEK